MAVQLRHPEAQVQTCSGIVLPPLDPAVSGYLIILRGALKPVIQAKSFLCVLVATETGVPSHC